MSESTSGSQHFISRYGTKMDCSPVEHFAIDSVACLCHFWLHQQNVILSLQQASPQLTYDIMESMMMLHTTQNELFIVDVLQQHIQDRRKAVCPQHRSQHNNGFAETVDAFCCLHFTN